MKALTLWPEWLPAICYMGKTIENRGWKPPDSLLGQRFALHAGKNIGGGSVSQGIQWLTGAAHHAGWAVIYEAGGLVGGRKEGPKLRFRSADTKPRRVPIVTGAVVATAVLVSASETDDYGSRWSMPDQWHWLLKDVRILTTPIPTRGRQGLWTWTPPGPFETEAA